ncbi:hypothetical protein [Nonomuraea insulae]|uniref:Uncharacterized protein n=1 Tax=Nonomuraea insulae TaxID=1616787 RepID=A0ABW1D118_9ACTN
MIRAWVRLDVRERQLSVLCNTFPDWTIGYELGPADSWVWKATARWDLTLEMVTAGALPEVQCDNPVELMANLTFQAWLMERLIPPRP